MKVVLGRMIDLRKKNCSINCATNNWMIIIGYGKSRGHQMLNEKIAEIDQPIIPTSQMTKVEAVRIMKKTKKDNEGWITIGKKM